MFGAIYDDDDGSRAVRDRESAHVEHFLYEEKRSVPAMEQHKLSNYKHRHAKHDDERHRKKKTRRRKSDEIL